MTAAYPVPHFLILDEMNLARVEYYFSDFLSALESGRSADEGLNGLTEAEIDLHAATDSAPADSGQLIPSTLRLPPNLYVIGTVNMDETTFAFSPKVLDRAFTIEFNEVNLDDYPPEEGEGDLVEAEKAALRTDFARGGRFTWHDKSDVRRLAQAHEYALDTLRELNRLLPAQVTWRHLWLLFAAGCAVGGAMTAIHDAHIGAVTPTISKGLFALAAAGSAMHAWRTIRTHRGAADGR